MPRGDNTRVKDIQMNRVIRFGVAAALVVGGASVALAQETGSIPPGQENYGQLISGLQTGTATPPDLTAFTETSTVNCVKVSTLQGAEQASALDNAITQNQANLTALQSSVGGNEPFLSKVEESCAVAELDPAQILMIESEAGGAFKVWIDDRAMAGGAMGAGAGATTTPAPASGG
jgi:hypothetical protein